jgi:hypothetical protein
MAEVGCERRCETRRSLLSLDWRARRAELAARLPDDTCAEVVGKLATLLDG